MTRIVKRHRGKLVLAAASLALVCLALAGFRGETTEAAPREIELVARGVAFHLDGESGGANPTLRLRRGEPVRFTVRNAEPGQVLHCFTIPGLGVHSTRDLATGESETFELVPGKRGSYAYACMLHPGMGGAVVVD